jgi:long-chain acyl-CoA synthetase
MSNASSQEIHDAVAGQTAPRLFLKLVAQQPNLPALHSMKSDAPGSWNVWTFQEFADNVAKSAAGFIAHGLAAHERVLLLMRNRPDFHWFDAAAQFCRATPVSIYNSSSPEEIQYLSNHAEAEIAIVEDAGFLERILKVRGDLPLLKKIFVIHPPEGALPDGVFSVDELMSHGTADLAALAAATEQSDIATLIYTSGTTGPPKGVMIDQYNVVTTVEILKRCIDFETFIGKKAISYLPMAHIAERGMSHYQGMILGYSVYCCPDPGQIALYLKEVRPEIIFGVPRVWEKLYLGVNAALSADPDRKAQFDAAVEGAKKIRPAVAAGVATDEHKAMLAQMDVAFAQVKGMVGLDSVEVAVTGAAAIPPSILDWFNAIGVPLSEIYGMSESTGPLTWSPHANRSGYVGRVVPGGEIKIEDDGEVCYRGPNVFKGYLKQDDKTAETIIDGWLHSGDIGIVDDGYLKIVDRKKELIITSGGKNISPANLEAALKTIPIVGQAAAIGDDRKYCTAILVLDPDSAAVWAKANGKADKSLAELSTDADVLAFVQGGVTEINKQFAQVEQIKKFALIGEEWMPDSDVLTPTSKLKRRGVNARYATEIESMYEGA